MKIGTVKEIKVHEYRVGLTPAGVSALVGEGHEIWVQRGAGCGAHFGDADYEKAGAQIADSAEEVFSTCDLIVKVKEPQLNECALLRPGQILFTYLHLAADRPQAQALLASGATAIAYETVTASDGTLPLLSPMSEVAGRLSIQAGAFALQKATGGRGVLLGGVPGVLPGKVLIIGGGVAGTNAAQIAVGMGAHVTVLDKSLPRLRFIEQLYQGRINTVYSTPDSVSQLSQESDLIVGAVLVAGAASPQLLLKEQVECLKEGTVLVDISIDQGGCFATSRPTNHAQPTFIHAGVVHYCVTNMPGAVPRTSTLALSHATLPAIRSLCRDGLEKTIAQDEHLLAGINVHEGKLRHQAVAHALGLPHFPLLS